MVTLRWCLVIVGGKGLLSHLGGLLSSDEPSAIFFGHPLGSSLMGFFTAKSPPPDESKVSREDSTDHNSSPFLWLFFSSKNGPKHM